MAVAKSCCTQQLRAHVVIRHPLQHRDACPAAAQLQQTGASRGQCLSTASRRRAAAGHSLLSHAARTAAEWPRACLAGAGCGHRVPCVTGRALAAADALSGGAQQGQQHRRHAPELTHLPAAAPLASRLPWGSLGSLELSAPALWTQ